MSNKTNTILLEDTNEQSDINVKSVEELDIAVPDKDDDN